MAAAEPTLDCPSANRIFAGATRFDARAARLDPLGVYAGTDTNATHRGEGLAGADRLLHDSIADPPRSHRFATWRTVIAATPLGAPLTIEVEANPPTLSRTLIPALIGAASRRNAATAAPARPTPLCDKRPSADAWPDRA